jgi:DNA-binding MarR family transcriptional regulator
MPLAGRLEQRGLLRRIPDPDDARAFRATLTPEGQRKLAHARTTHDAVLARMIAPHVTHNSLGAVEHALGEIIGGW